MRLVLILISGVSLMSAGCSTLHQVESGQKEHWMADAQDDLVGRDATVITRDGRGFEGKITEMNSDSLRLREERRDSLLAIEVNHVSSIRQPRKVWPAIGGFFAGALAGAVIGGSIASSQEEPRAEVLGFNTVAAGIGGAAIGALIGCVAGASILGLATAVTDYHIIYTPPPGVPVPLSPAIPDSTSKGR